MNWKKRKKLRQKLQHYQSKRIKSLIRLLNELTDISGKHVSRKCRAAFLKFCKQRPLHNYDEIVRKKAIRQKPKLPSVPTRNGRTYDYNGFVNAINIDKRIATLMKQNKWRGELDHPTDTVNVEVTVQEFNKPNRMKRQYDPNGISDADVGRIVGGEAIEYPNSAVIDLRNVAIAPRLAISPEGKVSINAFSLVDNKATHQQ